ncbi:AP-4 complex subunit epsilon, partial [Mucuna pruriens]
MSSIVSKGLLYEDKGDTHISCYCDANRAGSPIDRQSTTGFCISIGGNVVSWKSKKQNTDARSSAEAEYRAMALETCELIWVKQLIQELKFADVQPMKLYGDNQAALHIASNPIFHKRTKHIEIDYHFVREKLLAKEISTEFVNSSNQLADIFTKSLRGPQILVDKNLSFLNGYVQQSLERGALPYIPEDERFGMVNISNFRSQDQHESAQHGLRFEAYEVPKPPMPSKVAPVSLSSSRDLVPVPQALYSRETHQISSVGLASETGSSELKLKLDGVQRKWGRSTYSSPTSSSSNSTSQNPVNGVTQTDVSTGVNSKVSDNYDTRKQQIEISPEKQKLAASLFGGSTKTEKRSSTSNKVPKASASAADRTQESKAASEVAREKANQQSSPPDLLDLDESIVTVAPPSVDPFKQLEGLLDPKH